MTYITNNFNKILKRAASQKFSNAYDLKVFMGSFPWNIYSLEDYKEVQQMLKKELKRLLAEEEQIGKTLYGK